MSISSVQFSRSVASNSLQPHGLQHARLPCPSPIPGACSNSCTQSQRWRPTISYENMSIRGKKKGKNDHVRLLVWMNDAVVYWDEQGQGNLMWLDEQWESRIQSLSYPRCVCVLSHFSNVWLFATTEEPSRLLSPWDSPGKHTRVGCHALLQRIFPTQRSNPGLPHCRQILYQLSYQGSPSKARQYQIGSWLCEAQKSWPGWR